MNEEQLATLLAEHLDAILDGASIPDDLPAEVAELLGVAQQLADAAPTPRPEFGPGLKEALHAPHNGSLAGPGSAIDNSTFLMLGIGLLILVAGGALVVSLLVFAGVRASLPETAAPTPAPTEAQPMIASPAASPTPAPTHTATAQSQVITPTMTGEPAVTPTPPAEPASPSLTATPIIDVLQVVTVSVEVRVNPPSLSPGDNNSGGSSSGGGSGGGGGGDDDDDDGGGDDDD